MIRTIDVLALNHAVPQTEIAGLLQTHSAVHLNNSADIASRWPLLAVES